MSDYPLLRDTTTSYAERGNSLGLTHCGRRARFRINDEYQSVVAACRPCFYRVKFTFDLLERILDFLDANDLPHDLELMNRAKETVR